MKRSGYIVLMVCMVVVTVSAIVLRVPRTVPLEECSEVYKRYYKVEGVRATYVKNYPLNDTLTIGVTLLEATDSSGWGVLQRDFGITPLPPEVLAFLDSNSVDLWMASKDDYCKGKDSVNLNNDIIAVSYYRQKVSVFSIESEEQLDAIFENQIKSTKK